MKKIPFILLTAILTGLCSCRQQTEIPVGILSDDLTMTASFSETDNTSVTLEATLTVDASLYNETGFRYGTSDSEINKEVSGVAISGNKFSAQLKGLTADTKYYFIAYANSAHKKLTAQKDFTTLPNAPVIDTCYTRNVHAETATVILKTSGGSVTEWGYYLSDKPDFSEMEPTYRKEGSTETSFDLSLKDNTQYYFKAFVKNSKGSGESRILTIRTSRKGAPEVTTGEVTDIQASTACCNDNGITELYESSLKSCGLVWDTQLDPTLDECEGYSIENQSNNWFSGKLKGLKNNTKYYVRAYAVNGNGAGYGDVVTFETKADGIPYVSTDSITEILPTSVTVQGTVVTDGGHSVTARGMVWCKASEETLPELGKCEGFTQDQSGLGIFVSRLTGLSLGDEYCVRAYATNARGTEYGDTLHFLPAGKYATVVTEQVSAITSTTAVSGGNITDNGLLDITGRGLVWSTEEMPTLENCTGHAECGEGMGQFSKLMTGLLPETKYFVRAYAVNQRGTAYDMQQQSFTTLKAGNVEDFGTDPYEW